ncbi:hypothetical protein FRC11_010434 [Ceratobasidium sp. 423]|nr:hypothetical protein FRC11_010434 [Ceratobasidium sp. 423]
MIQPLLFAHLLCNHEAPSESLPVDVNEPLPPDPTVGSGTDLVDEQPHNNITLGYLVSVFHHYSEPPAPPTGQGCPPGPKKDHIVKLDCMWLDTMTCYKVLGFKFKMWWTRSSGGKTGASTIKTDADYDIIRNQLLALKHSNKDMIVSISFNTDQMDTFRHVHKWPAPSDLMEDGCGPSIGTKIPCLADMDAPSQLHGIQIMKLKETH